MAYEKQTWVDYPDETTPISAERLNHIEEGIENAGESAGNLEIGFNDAPYQIQNDIAMMCINLHTYDEEDEEVIQSSEPCPGPDTFYQLKAFLDCKIKATQDPYDVALTRDTTESLNVYYKDGENVEYQYELEAGNMPWMRYKINDAYTLPDGVDINTIPSALECAFRSTNYSGQDDTICYVKYSGDILPTYLFTISDASNIYYAVALRSTGYSTYVYIIPVNVSTHKIVTNDFIGKRYAEYTYAYYPFNLKYTISSSGGIQKDFTFSNVSSIPVYYRDNGNYVAYTMAGQPFVNTYINNFDTSKLKIDTVTANLHDGTSLNHEYMGQNIDIASAGNDSFNGDYYIYALDSDKCLLVVSYVSGGGTYIYATILDTTNHTFTAQPELYGGSGSSPYIPMTLTFEEINLIDDNNVSSKTTYSSKKIEALIANLQAQINALQ